MRPLNYLTEGDIPVDQKRNLVLMFGYYAAVLFNFMFAILSTVTLLGIILITRPQQPMHNVPPDWWVPISLIMIPGQILGQYYVGKTIIRREVPTPLAISQQQRMPPWFLRYFVAMMWGCNFLIGLIIVISLYKPAPGVPMTTLAMVLVAFVTFSLTSITNVYWMLMIRTLTESEDLIKLAWTFRYIISGVISVAAIVYYKLVF